MCWPGGRGEQLVVYGAAVRLYSAARVSLGRDPAETGSRGGFSDPPALPTVGGLVVRFFVEFMGYGAGIVFPDADAGGRGDLMLMLEVERT